MTIPSISTNQGKNTAVNILLSECSQSDVEFEVPFTACSQHLHQSVIFLDSLDWKTRTANVVLPMIDSVAAAA